MIRATLAVTMSGLVALGGCSREQPSLNSSAEERVQPAAKEQVEIQAESDTIRQAFEAARQQGAYRLIAATMVGSDNIQVWQEQLRPDFPEFGRFLLAVFAPTGKCRDFCSGEFVGSPHPYFQTDRYFALEASTRLGKDRDVFFVYDAETGKFAQHSVSRFINHVHRDIVIAGDAVFFNGCKDVRPVGRLDLNTGAVTMYGSPAPQSARFYLAGGEVFIRGTDRKTYRVDAGMLTRVDARLPEGPGVEMPFESILIPARAAEAAPPAQSVAGRELEEAAGR